MTSPAPKNSGQPGRPVPSSSVATMVPSGRNPENRPARSAPSRGSASYQQKKANAVTTTAR
ncbi:hypothetical protein Sme01_27840 [Sphaerisporangium melleum]|uniref:Uncharacterized protein n=1 Tax=Sphaerisporangium melleum TaxID=321316 RepID=A0A917QVL9_9ACTN|nr:hypothetical protein GCM10007964_11510 [Sphaerisporangium melleum]GII70308.1 hypothetical protein Sme01_27840 [Sphaerisporangium melleum]